MNKAIVIGNCQADSIASCMRLLSPTTNVLALTFNHFPFYDSSPEKILEAVAKADFVISQEFEAGSFGRLTSRDIEHAARRFSLCPNITFGGFHPDIVYVSRGDGSAYSSPMDSYHSALILYGFSQGYSAEQIASLFCESSFRAVSYFAAWGLARAALLENPARHGLDIDNLFRHWMRTGCFMHTTNHPKIAVLADVAKALLQKLELPSRDLDCTNYMTDVYMSTVWALYPELATPLGLKGSYMFKRLTSVAQLVNPIEEVDLCFDLTQMISASLRLYEADPKVAEDCARVRYWQQDKSISAALQR